MSTSSTNTKINKFIRYARKKWKTSNRSELEEQLKVGRIKRRVKRYTRSKSKGGSKIYSKEAVDIWRNGILKEGRGTVSRADLHDFGYLIGSDLLTPKAKKYLIKNIIRRLGLTKDSAEKHGVQKGDKKRTAVAATLNKFANRGFTGFSVRHGGNKFTYQPKHYLKVAQLIKEAEIDVVFFDSESGRNGSFSPKNNVIRILSGRSELARQSTVIHEATHAIQDLHNLPGTVDEWEVGAHIAQGMSLAYAAGIDSLGGSDPDKKSSSERRLGSAEFVSMVSEIVSTGKLVEVPSLILDDAKKVLAKHGYKDKIGVKVKQDVFDKGNFIDLWLNL
jgi:hypothetical protein